MLRSFKVLVVALAALAPSQAFADVITFEDLTLASNSYENGANLLGSFVSGGATFNNSYLAQYDAWTGWSYSNVNDTKTEGYMNQYAVYSPGVGDKSTNYAVAFVAYDGASTIDLAAGQRATSMRIDSTTYTALAIQNGYFNAKKFGGASGNDADYLLLTITGIDTVRNVTTGKIDFYLADYRFADNSKDYIVSDWTTLDLTSLGDATRLSFKMTGTDNDPTYGLNTPGYFAMDNLQTQAVPEPSSLALIGLGLAGAAIKWRRRRATK